MVDQIVDLFHTTHKVKTEQVVWIRGQRCGSRDIELVGYLTNVTGPMPLVLDLRITHDRFGSRSDPSINDHLHYPNDFDGSLKEDTRESFSCPSKESVGGKVLEHRQHYVYLALTLYLLFK